jgi:hypothetical protein
MPNAGPVVGVREPERLAPSWHIPCTQLHEFPEQTAVLHGTWAPVRFPMPVVFTGGNRFAQSRILHV